MSYTVGQRVVIREDFRAENEPEEVYVVLSDSEGKGRVDIATERELEISRVSRYIAPIEVVRCSMLKEV